MTKTKREPRITSALTLWDRLSKSGLAPDTYDAEFVKAFAKCLHLTEGKDVRRELARVAPDVTDAMLAFFNAAEPYSAMANDIWNMFAHAGAKLGDSNMAIDFDFGRSREAAIRFDLDKFKDFHEVIEETVRNVRRVDFSRATMHERFTAIPMYNVKARSSSVARWESEYGAGHWAPVPAIPSSGDASADEAIHAARGIVEVYVQLMRSHGIAPGRREGTVPVDDLVGSLAQDNTDHWSRSMLLALDELAHRIKRGEEAKKADDALARLGTFIAQVSTVGLEKVLAKRLSEFLRLPMWQYRHALFGLWTATQISEAIGFDRLKFHPVNGVLTFRFEATHVATVAGGEYLLYAELRTPATGLLGKGRTRNIQPDWRIVRPPAHHAASQVLIVECKQYAKPSRENFVSAAIDYAANSGNAKVVVANYSDMDGATLTSRLPARFSKGWKKVAPRVSLLGGLRPGQDAAIRKFRAIVADSITVEPGDAAPTPVVEGPARDSLVPEKGALIELAWSDADVDLDLHILARSELMDGERSHISYSERGRADAWPYFVLEEDIQGGGSDRERVTMHRAAEGICQVWVHLYRGEKLPASTTFHCLAGRAKLTLPLDGRAAAGARAWHAFNTVWGRLDIIDKYAQELP